MTNFNRQGPEVVENNYGANGHVSVNNFGGEGRTAIQNNFDATEKSPKNKEKEEERSVWEKFICWFKKLF